MRMLIVETVEAEGVGARAGIQRGDQLLSYAEQPLLSPAMLQALEENTFGVRSVTIQAERAGQALEFVVPSATLGLSTRRFLPSALLPHYEAARTAFLAGMYADAAKQWINLAEQTEEAEAKAWLLGWAGGAWQKEAKWDQAIGVYTRAWEQLQGGADTATQSQTATALGRCHQNRSEWKEASAWYERAGQTDAQQGRERWQAGSLNNLGAVAWQQGDLPAAQDYFSRALSIRERLAPNSLEVAASLNSLGNVAWQQGDPAEARNYYTRALTIKEHLAPDSLDMAISLNNLGLVAWEYSDLQAAQDYHTRALAIQERLAPNSMDVAASLNNLGTVVWQRGDLHAAQDYITQSLTIRERLAPDSLDVAVNLNNLGLVTWHRGDLQAAQDYYRRSLAIQERLAPGSLDVAVSLNNLGAVAWQRGDPSGAQDYYTRALTIRERLAPDSLDTASSLNNLGNVVCQQGDLPAAKDYYRRSLTIKERLAPDSLDVAASLYNLGAVASLQGDLQAAQDYNTRALSIRERLAPNSLDVAASLNSLGTIAWQRGDPAGAQDYHIRALTIQERVAPSSLDKSETLTNLGQTFLRQQRPAQALPYLEQAVQILEQQRSVIHSLEARALLLAQHITRYAALIQCYLALQQPEHAFATLERSRARSLLELLAERQLDFTAEAPSGLIDEQRLLNQQFEHTYNQLAELSAGDEDTLRVNSLHQKVRDLERRQQDLTTQMHATSPRYAALQYPQPLSLADTQAALEPGTLLLSYLIDEEQTFLFAVTTHNLQVTPLPLGRKALQDKIHSLRELLDWRMGTNRIRTQVEKAIALGRELYADLIHPVSAMLPEAQRFLFCPDGPLHVLPFAALVSNSRGTPRYLGANRPFHGILSATLYAQSRAPGPLPSADTPAPVPTPDPLSSDRSSPPASIFRRLLAFGDPIYSTASAIPASTRVHRAGRRPKESVFEETAISDPSAPGLAGAIPEEFQTRRLSLEPLPHTRAEVLAIKSLFGEAATVKLGAEATKTIVLHESADADVLHFACHGFVDAKMPLNSGLVLSRTETSEEGETVGGNGFLQAWEIFQKVRIHAELVVLSACETGLGQEVRGEGLIGLARAFQYAGARNLVVSLWKVNDASTSVFMEGFYRALKSGERKEEAMRAGIAAVQAHPEWKAPYFWSAFVLIGSRA